MQLHISPRNLTLTAAIHQYAAEKVSHLEDLADIIGVHLVLAHVAGVNRTKSYTVKAHVAVAGPDIHAEGTGDDLYAVLDKITDRVARQLRKRHTAIIDKRREKLHRAKEKRKRAGA